MIFVWLRDFPRRIGQKAQLFVRFIRIVLNGIQNDVETREYFYIGDLQQQSNGLEQISGGDGSPGILQW